MAQFLQIPAKDKIVPVAQSCPEQAVTVFVNVRKVNL